MSIEIIPDGAVCHSFEMWFLGHNKYKFVWFACSLDEVQLLLDTSLSPVISSRSQHYLLIMDTNTHVIVTKVYTDESSISINIYADTYYDTVCGLAHEFSCVKL